MNRFSAFAVAFVLGTQSTSASAQLSGTKTPTGCIAVSKASASVTAEGRLTLRHMPGGPNFESIRRGDEDRLTLILVLPSSVCIDDGGDFANPKVRFRTVHIWSINPTVHRKLKESVGKIVTIRGEAYARNNGLHYAPLVLKAKTVIAR
jgi:hypothetical protein